MPTRDRPVQPRLCRSRARPTERRNAEQGCARYLRGFVTGFGCQARNAARPPRPPAITRSSRASSTPRRPSYATRAVGPRAPCGIIHAPIRSVGPAGTMTLAVSRESATTNVARGPRRALLLLLELRNQRRPQRRTASSAIPARRRSQPHAPQVQLGHCPHPFSELNIGASSPFEGARTGCTAA
jgi:hypothetical protein